MQHAAVSLGRHVIPEVKHERRLPNNLVHFGAFVCGVGLILVTRAVLDT
jgi:hypothetical protein